MLSKKTVKPGMIVTVKQEVRMDYYGYWPNPRKMFEYLRPGDPAIVTMYVDTKYALCQFIRNNVMLRCQINYDNMTIINKPTLYDLNIQGQVLAESYQIVGEYIWNQKESATEYMDRNKLR